ncbi:MAG: FAD-dependent oxidoreductase, partial [Candidatus Heimdallarchaeaceae archaeon]
MSTEEEKPRIGVFICKCGKNIAAKVGVENLAEYAKELENVEVSQVNTFTCSAVGQGAIEEAVKTHNLNRVVVASCSPTMHESTFQTVTEEAGLNKYQFQMANIREFASWVTKDPEQATNKAKRLVTGAVARVSHHEPLEETIVPVNPNTLIVGGGIAGISAALKIADAGHKVYLVEKSPSIGGRMAQLDKTFPTLDCAACILTPKMVDIGKHPNVELLTYSELVSVDGYVGNFKAKIKKKPRFIDMEKCTACADCSDVCPVLVPSEFDEGLAMRRAIYVPFPQSVPQKYTIDKRPERSPCRVGCPIDNNPHAYVRLISHQKYDVAMSKIREANPFPSICGRVCEHTCEDVCKRGEFDDPIAIMALKRFASDHFRKNEDPVETITPTRSEKVAIIGAGPAGLTCASKLLEKGYPVTVFDESDKPGGLMTRCLPNYRIPEEVAMYDVKRILDSGVNLKNNTKVGRDISLEDLRKEYQAVFIAIGMQNPAKLDLPGIDLEGVLYGLPFLKDVKEGKKPKELGNNVIVIGGGNVAIDCAKSALRLGAKEVNVVCLESRDLSCDDAMPAHEWEIEDTEEEGMKIHTYLGPERILGDDGKIKGMETKVCVSVYSEDGSFHPLYSGEKGPTIEADTVIIAIGQRTDLTGFESLETGIAGTLKADSITYETSQPGIFAGGDIVFGTPSVVNAIMEGTEASISIDRLLNNEDLKVGRIKDTSKVEVVDRDVEIKPRVKMPKAPVDERIKDFREIDLGYSEEQAMIEAERCISCAVCCECLECDIICEPKAIDHTQKEEILDVDVGAIVVATGFDGFDATRKPEYGYKKYPNVITSFEFERMSSASGPTEGELVRKDGKPIDSVAILHCVGSRDINTNEYCSRLCCMNALKDANIIREKLPDSTVYEF